MTPDEFPLPFTTDASERVRRNVIETVAIAGRPVMSAELAAGGPPLVWLPERAG